MKKTLVLLGISLLSVTGFAQTDLFTNMEKMGSEVKYKAFNVSGNDADGYLLSSPSESFTIEVNKNKYGRGAGFTTYKEDGTKKDQLFNKYYKPDHYTHPIYLTKPSDAWSYRSYYVMVDSVIYDLWKLEDDGSSFEIKYLWIPMIEKEAASGESKEEDSGKKMSMKEKMAAAKEKAKALAAGGSYGPLYDKQKKAKHQEIIKNYIAGMKKVQAANPITPAIQKELDGLQADIDAENADIKATNDAYWTSAEGQAKLAKMNKEDIVLVNDTGGDFGICFGQGAWDVLKPGETHKVDCSFDPIYRGYKQQGVENLKKGEKIFEPNGNNCGAKINISSLIK